MTKGRISDWISEINKVPEFANKFYYMDKKLEDQRRLRESSLPSADFLSFKIKEINLDILKEFFNKHKGVFLRVVPDEEGLSRGLKKKYTFGYYNLEYFLNFINKTKEEDEAYKLVEFQEWEEDIYGWILISNGKRVIAEISKNLDELAHNNQVPLSSFIAETDEFSHKINWIKKEEESAKFLERALKHLLNKKEDYFLKGYFEGTTGKNRKNLFFDWKVNPIYFDSI
jgi:hypothetical protein